MGTAQSYSPGGGPTAAGLGACFLREFTPAAFDVNGFYNNSVPTVYNSEQSGYYQATVRDIQNMWLRTGQQVNGSTSFAGAEFTNGDVIGGSANAGMPLMCFQNTGAVVVFLTFSCVLDYAVFALATSVFANTAIPIPPSHCNTVSSTTKATSGSGKNFITAVVTGNPQVPPAVRDILTSTTSAAIPQTSPGALMSTGHDHPTDPVAAWAGQALQKVGTAAKSVIKGVARGGLSSLPDELLSAGKSLVGDIFPFLAAL